MSCLEESSSKRKLKCKIMSFYRPVSCETSYKLLRSGMLVGKPKKNAMFLLYVVVFVCYILTVLHHPQIRNFDTNMIFTPQKPFRVKISSNMLVFASYLQLAFSSNICPLL